MQGRGSDAFFDLTSSARFVDPLPALRQANPIEHRPHPEDAGRRIAHYRIAMHQFETQVHRDMRPATFWGYGGSCRGPTFEVKSGEPMSVEWVNALPKEHMFPIDHTLHGAERGVPEVRTAVHLHGGRVGPESDGYPEKWFTPGQSAHAFYPNRQEATALFYHDHAMGITRLNAAPGLMGLYLIRDAFENSLNLPSGPYEIPIVLFDRSLRGDGQIYYPVSGNPNSPWVSEYYGGGILVNGKLFPYLEVEPRKYRFRILNASNGSFYALSFGAGARLSSPCILFSQIASDQGFLAMPSHMDQLILGPGERADIVADFRSSAGEELYFRTKITPVLQIRVSQRKVNDPSDLPSVLRPSERLPETAATKIRNLTLADYQDRLGRSKTMLLNGMHWSMPVTERPILGSAEIWSFINLTDDSHPIHLHLVRFQILDRQLYDLPTYQLTGKIVFTGPAQQLAANELGWKDTGRADP